MDIQLLKTFVLYGSNCRRRKHEKYLWEHDHKEGKYIFSFRVEDMVYSCTQDLNSAYLRYHCLPSDHSRYHCLASDQSNFEREFARFRETIKFFVQESCITWLDYYSLGDDGDGQLTMDFIDSLLRNLDGLLIEKLRYGRAFMYLPENLETLREKLKFLKSFIGFAILQGVDRKQLIDLLIHVEDVAVNAAKLISLCWWLEGDDGQDCNDKRDEVSQLIHKKINPFDPHVRETYIHVLTALKLSRSLSQALALEKNKHLVVADFIDCLLDIILGSFSSFTVSVNNQMQKLHQGATFLSILHRQQQKKFNALNDEMKDLIGVVVIDTGIVICSFYVNEMKDCLPKETDLALFHLLKVLKFIMAEVASIYSPSSFTFPRTNELGSIDFLLTNLKEIGISEANSIAFPAGRIHTIHEDLEFLRSFLENIAEQCSQIEKLQTLWNHVMEVAYKAELVIDSIVVGEKPECLDTIARDIKLMKIEALKIDDNMIHGSEAQTVTKNSILIASEHSSVALNEIFVGLDDEVKTIIDRLTRGSKKLDIVSIVGMAGLGKTTLANKVYNHPSISCHFHVRVWCCVSQVHSRHGLLTQILCSIASESPDQYQKENEDDLAEQLYKHLKRNRYVIVLDDVWDIDAWSSMETSFPDDANGSRILMTSRSHTLPLKIKLDSKPHHLRHLSDEESWELMQSWIFGQMGCPPALNGVGMQIAKICKGLPLTVVVVAGILASTEQDSWEEVANGLSSRTVVETEHCINTIGLSYKYLPDYLKPCLLYFSAFEEDQKIPVRQLKLLWISEGFVQKTDQIKNVEDVADNYLMDLIHRSLVMVSQERSLGGVKACRIHDLVHEFCVAKAKEDSFLQIVPASNGLFPFSQLHNSHRLCIYLNRAEELNTSRLFFPHLRSLLYFFKKFKVNEYSCIFRILRMCKLLRVLDLGGINLYGNFPRELEFLVHLRFLVITSPLKSIPSAIANLSRLETFIIQRGIRVRLPNSIWTMKKLRHLWVDGGFILPNENLDASPNLYHLESLAIDVSSKSLQKILIKLPSIRRLKCFGVRSRNSTIVLDSLSRLESLKVDYFSGDFSFPLNLKKLTLKHSNHPWSEISTIGKLPNLEVLKLLYKSFLGDIWEMKEGEFLKLRFLKLEKLDIVRWTASCDNFPPIQKLVLSGCRKLQEVPSCLEEIITIEMIEVSYCHKSAVNLVKQIQQQQMDIGNDGMKIIIRKYP
ncbi:hypothetical protein ACH5RR_022548 [Cinchona calisaya]|uniref:G protein gamma domain-containing protein n=1 Tax=Cinchona calisaya TaxID=153742 RepID=A0ABD2Z840_9GENT